MMQCRERFVFKSFLWKLLQSKFSLFNWSQQSFFPSTLNWFGWFETFQGKILVLTEMKAFIILSNIWFQTNVQRSSSTKYSKYTIIIMYTFLRLAVISSISSFFDVRSIKNSDTNSLPSVKKRVQWVI